MDQDIVTASALLAENPGVPAQTVYSRIRKMVRGGELQVVGRGVYSRVPKLKYRVEITPWMRQVADILEKECEGVNFCVTDKEQNLVIEVDKADIPLVSSLLQNHGQKVLQAKQATSSPVPPEGYVIVGPYISEMPVMEEDGIDVPSLEKKIVDSLDGNPDMLAIQKTAEAYHLNINKMRRYAARRGKGEELEKLLSSLNQDRIKMISCVQKYFAGCAVTKAWVFGSFARGEETPSSDLDLLVEYDKTAGLSLLGIIRYQLDLEKIISREVDLIENGCLRQFAVESANRDKYLIYERR